MSKKTLPGATLLAPLPAVMVSVGDSDNANVITVAWTGIVCSQPPRLYVSVRHDRFSYDILKRCGEFVVNLTSEKLLAACDYCGIRSGRDIDKFAEMGFTKERGDVVSAPMIAESPINLECKVFDVLPLGSHDMFSCRHRGGACRRRHYRRRQNRLCRGKTCQLSARRVLCHGAAIGTFRLCGAEEVYFALRQGRKCRVAQRRIDQT